MVQSPELKCSGFKVRPEPRSPLSKSAEREEESRCLATHWCGREQDASTLPAREQKSSIAYLRTRLFSVSVPVWHWFSLLDHL